MTKRYRALIPLLLVLSLALTGCPQHGPLVLAKDAAITNQAFERAVATGHRDGIVDDATERDLLGYSRKIAQYDDAAVTAIQNANKTSALAAIDQAIQTLDDAITTGLAGVKNPTKQTEFHSILLALRGTLTTAKALLS
jgi:predicted small lipoprotein YifL